MGVNWAVIIMVPVALIMTVVMLQILDPFISLAFTTIDSSQNMYYGSFIKLLIGSIGFIFALGLIWTVIRNLDTRTADFGPPPSDF